MYFSPSLSIAILESCQQKYHPLPKYKKSSVDPFPLGFFVASDQFVDLISGRQHDISADLHPLLQQCLDCLYFLFL